MTHDETEVQRLREERDQARSELKDLKKQLDEAKALVRELYEDKWGKPGSGSS